MIFVKRLLVSLLPLLLLQTPGPAVASDDAATVLITGANRGIGLAMAEAFAAGGYHVIGTARSPDRAVDLKNTGARVEQLDVTDMDSIGALRKRLADTPIDILVNNAGVLGTRTSTLGEVDMEEVAREFNVNSLGPLRVTQAMLPNLQAGSRKTVVNISSMMGSNEMNTWGCCVGYRASKAALNSINTTLSVEYAKQGMVFVVLHPGYVQTDMNEGKGNITPVASGQGLYKVISGLKPSDNGKFYDYKGEEMPW